MRFILFLFIAFAAAPALAEEPWPEEPWSKSRRSPAFEKKATEEKAWQYYKPEKEEREFYDASRSVRKQPCSEVPRKWGQSMETTEDYKRRVNCRD
jgi:hypothetical protein